MQDDAAKLVEIFSELNKLQGYQKQIQQVKKRLQKIMETENVKLEGPEFEAKLASNIHPFMYSYPEPLGDRYRDVQSLLDELADKSTKRGVQHQRYLETVMQFKDKGYRYALCNGNKFSPSNSGLNIDPGTYPFRSSASDNCLYFSNNTSDNSTTDTSSTSRSSPPVFFSTKEGIETASTLDESMICHPPSELPDTCSTSSSDSSSKSGPKQLSEGKWTQPESLVCNPPESTYQSLISQETYPPSPSLSKSSKTSSSRSTSSAKKSISPMTYDEISRYSELYCTPGTTTLDPDTYSRYQTVRSMVVSQTWLTGWIKDLYNIESEIVSATGKPLL
ncbi:uncharacterized protein LOC134825065 isoform X2 [Bolinopsis microptera]|uniref:uncharacterized protein LOC134825065 isoform X2 n=1 Tax=Bolinopsis microptera TaxID=2820187 RepID=UPI00307932BB